MIQVALEMEGYCCVCVKTEERIKQIVLKKKKRERGGGGGWVGGGAGVKREK